ncbi:MAG TPA: hypothetical protein VGR28_08555 [Candidatus Thermoplasmatota archaeon]|jgi:hypothetical protein|nr:hypothetical protein [Candidatus Thermoplasmatota archaeon]
MAARVPSAALVLALMLAVPALAAVPAAVAPPEFEHIDDAWRAEHPAIPVNHPFDANVPQLIPSDRVFVHNSQGFLNGLPAGYPAAFEFLLADVGQKGPEPSVGVDHDGRLFFKTCCSGNVVRSVDAGATWQDVTSPLADPQTNDPYLWLDPATDRVINDDLVFGGTFPGQGCSWATWTQLGEDAPAPNIWEGANARFCSAVPETSFVDHQKVHTGKIPPVHVLANKIPANDQIPQATFFAWNTGAISKITMSIDGGYTFPFLAGSAQGTCNGGLHGRPRSAPDGILLIPKRDCGNPLALRSVNFNTWDPIEVGEDVGTTSHRKNPDIAIDAAGNAYMFWPSGASGGLAAEPTWLSVSHDTGATWGASIKASPPNVLSTTFHAAVAGSPGRVAVMYYGNDHTANAPDHVRGTKWHAYITFSLNALDPDPTFVTVQLDTDSDPIQIGSISTNSDGHAEAGSRNLLDFNDLVLDPTTGRVVAAYADGCTTVNNCANNPSATSGVSRDNEGIAAINTLGPSLL